jgi:hypothetical protein
MTDLDVIRPALNGEDTIIDDGEEAESKVWVLLLLAMIVPISGRRFTGNSAHETARGGNGERGEQTSGTPGRSRTS